MDSTGSRMRPQADILNRGGLIFPSGVTYWGQGTG